MERRFFFYPISFYTSLSLDPPSRRVPGPALEQLGPRFELEPAAFLQFGAPVDAVVVFVDAQRRVQGGADLWRQNETNMNAMSWSRTWNATKKKKKRTHLIGHLLGVAGYEDVAALLNDQTPHHVGLLLQPVLHVPARRVWQSDWVNRDIGLVPWKTCSNGFCGSGGVLRLH